MIGSSIPSTYTSVRRPSPRSGALERDEREHAVGAHELAVAERDQHCRLPRHGRCAASYACRMPLTSRAMPDSDTFLLGGDLEVERLGFGAMRITGDRDLGRARRRRRLPRSCSATSSQPA